MDADGETDAVSMSSPPNLERFPAPDLRQPALATIVVVAYHSAVHWRRLLACVAAQTERRWRLIVWDNSTNLAQAISDKECPSWVTRVAHGENIGFAAANNAAADMSETPFLAFLNPDAFPEPEWLANLLQAASMYPGAASFGSTQWADPPASNAYRRLDGTGDVMHAMGIAYRSSYGIARPPPPTGETFSACAAAMLVRRDAFAEVGGFDARFFCYMEDVDLGFRLRLRGWSCIQVQNAIVEHIGGAASNAVGAASRHSAFADFHGARNRLWTYVKCMPDWMFWLLFPAHLVFTTAIGFAHMLQGRGPATLHGLSRGLMNLGPVIKQRKQEQHARTASLAAIAKAFIWNPMHLLGRQPHIRSTMNRSRR